MRYGTVNITLVRGRIQRTLPLELRPHIPEHKWKRFCDKYDAKAVVPAYNKAVNVFGICFVLTMLGFVLFYIGWDRTMSSTFAPLSPLIPIAFILFIGGFTSAICISAHRDKKLQQDIQQLCDEASRDFGAVTVHFKEHNSYHTSGNTTHRTRNAWLEIKYPQNAGVVASNGAVAQQTTTGTPPTMEASIPIANAEIVAVADKELDSRA